jgi:hypothetical protein
MRLLAVLLLAAALTHASKKIACIGLSDLGLKNKFACEQCNDMRWIRRDMALISPKLTGKLGVWGCQPLASICPASIVTLWGLTYPFAVLDGHCTSECHWQPLNGVIFATDTLGGSVSVPYGTTQFPKAIDAFNSCVSCCCQTARNAKCVFCFSRSPSSVTTNHPHTRAEDPTHAGNTARTL